jgi:CHRD domain
MRSNLSGFGQAADKSVQSYITYLLTVRSATRLSLSPDDQGETRDWKPDQIFIQKGRYVIERRIDMNKRKFISSLIAVSILALMLISAAPSQIQYSASLRGANEVPPVMTDAVGRFAAKVNSSETMLRVRLTVSNIDDVFASHIHCGPPGENGPIGVTLYAGDPVSFGSPGILVDSVFTEPNPGNACGWTSIADVVSAIESGGAYVNVHTLAVPSGEMRGNIQ